MLQGALNQKDQKKTQGMLVSGPLRVRICRRSRCSWYRCRGIFGIDGFVCTCHY